MNYYPYQNATLTSIDEIYEEFSERQVYIIENEMATEERLNSERILLFSALLYVINDVVTKVVEETLLEGEEEINSQISLFDGELSKENRFLRVNLKDLHQEIMDRTVNGKLYADKFTLSERIWRLTGDNMKMIDEILNRGLIEGKSHLSIAKELQFFLRHDGVGNIRWEAKRLARTMINQSHQQAQIESSKANPFVVRVRWNSVFSHNTCQICAERDGTEYELDEVPVDHPNGMCYLTNVMVPEEEMLEILLAMG